MPKGLKPTRTTISALTHTFKICYHANMHITYTVDGGFKITQTQPIDVCM